MATTKTKPKTKPKPSRNGPPTPAPEVMTLAEAAAYLRLDPAVVLRLAAAGELPGRAAEGEWRFLLDALKGWLTGADGVVRRATQLAVAGCLSDDPTLDSMVADMDRRRKADPVGGET